MTQKPLSKYFSIQPIENHRNKYQLNKNLATNSTSVQNHIGINTNHTEQITSNIHNGNTINDTVQISMQDETTETYWKLVTEQRQQAINETMVENQQLHSLIDQLNKQNDKLRIIANHYDYLQNVLETLTTENDSHIH